MLTCIAMVSTALCAQLGRPVVGAAVAAAPASRPAASQPAASQPSIPIRIYKVGETVTVDGITYVIESCDYKSKGGQSNGAGSSGRGGPNGQRDSGLDQRTPLDIMVWLFVTNPTPEQAKLLVGTIPLEDVHRNAFRPVPIWSTQTLHVPSNRSEKAHLQYSLPGMRPLRLCLTDSNGNKHLLPLPPPQRDVTPPVRSTP